MAAKGGERVSSGQAWWGRWAERLRKGFEKHDPSLDASGTATTSAEVLAEQARKSEQPAEAGKVGSTALADVGLEQVSPLDAHRTGAKDGKPGGSELPAHAPVRLGWTEAELPKVRGQSLGESSLSALLHDASVEEVAQALLQVPVRTERVAEGYVQVALPNGGYLGLSLGQEGRVTLKVDGKWPVGPREAYLYARWLQGAPQRSGDGFEVGKPLALPPPVEVKLGKLSVRLWGGLAQENALDPKAEAFLRAQYENVSGAQGIDVVPMGSSKERGAEPEATALAVVPRQAGPGVPEALWVETSPKWWAVQYRSKDDGGYHARVENGEVGLGSMRVRETPLSTLVESSSVESVLTALRSFPVDVRRTGENQVELQLPSKMETLRLTWGQHGVRLEEVLRDRDGQDLKVSELEPREAMAAWRWLREGRRGGGWDAALEKQVGTTSELQLEGQTVHVSGGASVTGEQVPEVILDVLRERYPGFREPFDLVVQQGSDGARLFTAMPRFVREEVRPSEPVTIELMGDRTVRTRGFRAEHGGLYRDSGEPVQVPPYGRAQQSPPGRSLEKGVAVEPGQWVVMSGDWVGLQQGLVSAVKGRIEQGDYFQLEGRRFASPRELKLLGAEELTGQRIWVSTGNASFFGTVLGPDASGQGLRVQPEGGNEGSPEGSAEGGAAEQVVNPAQQPFYLVEP